jgi:hypothetical protein
MGFAFLGIACFAPLTTHRPSREFFIRSGAASQIENVRRAPL